MNIKNSKSMVALSNDMQGNIYGGSQKNAWLNEALKLVIAYWGSIKTGFSDGYNDYWEEQK